MSTIKLMVVKCVTALLISTVMASSLVAFAAANPHSTVTIVDGEKTIELNTNRTTAEEILRDAEINLLVGDKAELKTDEDGVAVLTISRAFPVYITVGNETKMVSMVGGTVADALAAAEVTLDESSVCNLKPETVLNKETYIDVVSVKYVTETYEESIPFTAKVEYSSSLEKGKQKVTGGVNGTRAVTIKKTYKNGVVTETETVSTTVTKPAVDKVTVIGTKVVNKKKPATTVNANGTKPYSSIKPISSNSSFFNPSRFSIPNIVFNCSDKPFVSISSPSCTLVYILTTFSATESIILLILSLKSFPSRTSFLCAYIISLC